MDVTGYWPNVTAEILPPPPKMFSVVSCNFLYETNLI